jgi:hypothetical protein
MSYYDEDSEDEYYGYYGRNNHRKPKPSPTPPEPNHHIEEREPKLEVDEGYEPEGVEYEDDEDERYEPEYEGDEEELEELRPENEEDEVLETNGEVIRYEHGQLESGNDETPELRELEYETQEPHQLRRKYGIDEVQELGEPNLWTQQPPQLEYELERKLKSENDEVHELKEFEHEHQEPYELEYEPKRNDSDPTTGYTSPGRSRRAGYPNAQHPGTRVWIGVWIGVRTLLQHHPPCPTHTPAPNTLPLCPPHTRPTRAASPVRIDEVARPR